MKIHSVNSIGKNQLLKLAIENLYQQNQIENPLPRDASPADDNAEAFYATKCEETIACLVFYAYRPDIIWLDFIFVHKDHRSQGIGFAMMRALLDEATKRKISTIDLGTKNNNLKMQNLARKCGFQDFCLQMRMDLI